MKILGHIHTLNDEDVIEQSIKALLAQTYPVAEIVVVDNGSTDDTLQRSFPSNATVIRNEKNLGTSGAVMTGFKHALARQYDWIWVLDEDSVPLKDALEKLVKLYFDILPEERSQIGLLTSRTESVHSQRTMDYCMLTPKGPRPAKVMANQNFTDCDCTLWSGSLFNLKAVQRVGFPRFGTGGYWEDLSLDFGDIEYCYRLKQADYRVLVHQQSIINHPLGMPKQISVLGRNISSTNHPPFRRYLISRNMIYFWLYIYSGKKLFFIFFYLCGRLIIGSTKILMMEEDRLLKLRASLRGVWDGLLKNMQHQY